MFVKVLDNDDTIEVTHDGKRRKIRKDDFERLLPGGPGLTTEQEALLTQLDQELAKVGAIVPDGVTVRASDTNASYKNTTGGNVGPLTDTTESGLSTIGLTPAASGGSSGNARFDFLADGPDISTPALAAAAPNVIIINFETSPGDADDGVYILREQGAVGSDVFAYEQVQGGVGGDGFDLGARNAVNLGKIAAYPQGSVALLNGFKYKAEAGGVAGLDRAISGVTAVPDNTGFVSLDQFGAAGDDADVDNSVVIQRALDNHSCVFVPPTTFRTFNVFVNSNQKLRGLPGVSTLKRYDNSVANGPAPANSMYILASYAFNQGDADPANNKRNIEISGIRFDGRGSEATFGYQSFSHNVTFNSTTNCRVSDCEFIDFRGDGIYLGSGTSGGIERHNQDIVIERCTFDGTNQDNRNGLSVIDCDGLKVLNCKFRNIGNALLSASVGGIDFEPNQDYNIYRNVVISGCSFENIDTTNTSGITLFNGRQIIQNIGRIIIENNSFKNCFWGIASSAVIKTVDDQSDHIIIRDNHILDSVDIDIMASAWSGALIEGNTLELTTPGDATKRGGIIVGRFIDGQTRSGIGQRITNNVFRGLRPQFAAITLYSAIDVHMTGNQFHDILGDIFEFMPIASSPGPGQTFRNLRIEDNTVTNRLRHVGSLTTQNFLRFGVGLNTGLNNAFINGTNIERNNNLENGVLRNAGGPELIFAEQLDTVIPPVQGTWQVGQTLKDQTPGAGAVEAVCSSPGTFGTLTGVTCTANASDLFVTVVDDPSDSLRVGQYIQINGATYRQILSISDDRTTLYLNNTAGATGALLPITWRSPSFVVA